MYGVEKNREEINKRYGSTNFSFIFVHEKKGKEMCIYLVFPFLFLVCGLLYYKVKYYLKIEIKDIL